ncbi:MAG: hypothetical protein JW985_00230 [Alphaproteobacteria bacterium]|nr:hypothetical protein [Alphaproteobacteria bacterium]
MIIVFSKNTSKILPKIFCRKFRHCAVIFKYDDDKYLMLNPSLRTLDIFTLTQRDLNILKHNGWIFIKTNANTANQKHHLCSIKHSLSCVAVVKHIIGIKNPFIWTPGQLYKQLTKK